jgi:hypothetical protein
MYRSVHFLFSQPDQPELLWINRVRSKQVSNICMRTKKVSVILSGKNVNIVYIITYSVYKK